MATTAPLLTEKEARIRLGGIARNTIYTYRKQGLLTWQPIGKRVMYSEEDIQAFLELQSAMAA